MGSVKNSRNNDLAKIHIAKKALGLDDDTYREMLINVAGTTSSAQLDKDGRDKILEHLKQRGYKFHHKSAKASGMHQPASPDRAPLLSLIEALLASLEKPWSYADSIAHHVFKIEKVRWLKPEQLKVIMSLLMKNLKSVRAKETE